MTNQEIKTVGQTIAQETQIGGNTAARVGGVVEGIGVALDNKDAANGYYQATINGGTITVNAPDYKLTVGGNLRIKMPSAGTTASTLTIGNANAVQLWYNGAAVSDQNTWEADEIISVFYDGTRFMASNSQGGGGKAEKIIYDNSQSGLAADDVQGALDEVAVNIEEVDLSKYRVVSNNLEQNATVWKKPNQSFKSIIVPRCVFGDYLKLSPTNYKVSYAFLEYDNSGTKSAAVPFAGTQTTATTIPAGSNPVTVKIPSDCGCVYFYISEYSRDDIGDYYQVYSITERKDELDEMLVPTFGTEEAYDIKAGIVATNYNTNSGTYVISRPYQGTFNRALTQYPFILEKGEWLKCTVLDASVSIIAMSIDNDNHYLGYDFDIISNASGVIRGDGEKKAIWAKWTNDATITNVVELLKHISIVRGYDCSYSKKGTSDLKAIASENTDAGTSWLKEQLVLGGYTYSFGTVPQYSIRANTLVVSNSPCWLDDDIVIEFDEPIRCKTYILANDGTFRTSVQWESPMTIRGGRYIIMAFSYPDNRTITDIDSVLSLIRISKKKRIGADFLIDRNQDAVNAIVASKKRFDRTRSSYSYNAPNHSECFTIAHLTDIHTDSERFENFRRFVDNLGYIDAAILTGDLVIEPTEAQFKTITDVEGKKDVMMCVGNHDRAKAWGQTIVMSLSDVYANMFTARGVTTNTGKLYYYQDYVGTTKVQDVTLSNPVYKIRVIVLNCYDTTSTNATYAGVNLHYSQAQIDWFITTLQDAITNGFAVMVAMHAIDQQKMTVRNDKKFYQDHLYNETTPDAYEQYPIIEDIINAFKHGTSLTRNYTWNDISTTVNVDVTFQSAGTFIAYMCGHYHMDLIGVSQNYSDQLYLVGNCGHGYSYLAGRSYGEEWTPLSRTLGTKSEDCFNVYSINLDDKTIRVVRVGADINDKMEKVDFESYSFD
jgi:hypothetical protein